MATKGQNDNATKIMAYVVAMILLIPLLNFLLSGSIMGSEAVLYPAVFLGSFLTLLIKLLGLILPLGLGAALIIYFLFSDIHSCCGITLKKEFMFCPICGAERAKNIKAGSTITIVDNTPEKDVTGFTDAAGDKNREPAREDLGGEKKNPKRADRSGAKSAPTEKKSVKANSKAVKQSRNIKEEGKRNE